MDRSKGTVFIVDDDEAMRDSLRWLLESVGWQVDAYASGQAFLDQYRTDWPGCLLSDVRMPGMSGLQLQEALQHSGCGLPVILITGHGDVPMAVRAMKHGAVDFLEKPFNDQVLLDCVQRALARDAEQRRLRRVREEVRRCLAHLTERERQVMELVVGGASNREIAENLSLSPKTVEVHRAKMMHKMQASSVPELVRKAMLAGEPAALEA
jgi:RNA polymerase sigma factor (sigma-70 family)